MHLTDAELDDKVEALVQRKYPRLKLTQEDIAEMLFGDAFDRPHISKACRRLEDQRRVEVGGGRGVAHDPYWYRPYFELVRRRV